MTNYERYKLIYKEIKKIEEKYKNEGKTKEADICDYLSKKINGCENYIFITGYVYVKKGYCPGAGYRLDVWEDYYSRYDFDPAQFAKMLTDAIINFKGYEKDDYVEITFRTNPKVGRTIFNYMRLDK